uniref:Uncharacterized protein n=1 Tax=uncultured marine thaumarchaeote KM3_173_E01 TaxID=1456050 RepID=A0A075GQH0_9ARCH|nr:hypothetical protein [uncultured marine thaumarchaeote KM3_173_E01]
MKGFAIVLLGVIFVTLIAGSVQSVAADHLEPGKGIFKDENRVNLVLTKDSKYQIHIQIQILNEQGQLISIAETSGGKYIPHEITDNTFNEKLGKKEIVTIDNIKYEKVQYTNTLFYSAVAPNIWSSEFSHYLGLWVVQLCGVYDGHEDRCVPIFQANTSVGLITKDDVVVNQWTILRELN